MNPEQLKLWAIEASSIGIFGTVYYPTEDKLDELYSM